MNILEVIAAGRENVQIAQSNLEAAQTQLLKNQKLLDDIQPHLSLWDEVCQASENLSDEVKTELNAIAERGKALLGA